MIYDKDNIEFRLAESPLCDESTVYGRAIAFDVPSDNLAQFREIIRKGAVTQELLNSSDIYARVNHDDNYIMARCNHGKGSLKLELRDDGLYYSFTIPDTEKGRELREHIRRGEIAHSSFAYWSSDKNVRLEKRNGEVYRIVEKIDYLEDVSAVFFPAYNASSCSLRCAEQIEKFIKESEETENREGSVDNNVETPQNEAPQTNEEVGEPIENQNDTNNDGTPSDSDGNSNTEHREGESQTQIEENGNSSDSGVGSLGDNDGAGGITEPSENQDDNTNNNDEAIDTRGGDSSDNDSTADGMVNPETTDNSDNNSEYNERNININMKKEYRILDAINNVIANKPQDSISEAVNRAGQKCFTESGLASTGNIVIPCNVREGAISVTSDGEDLVPVDVFDILPSLKAKLLATKLGATILTGLNSDLTLPIGGKGTSAWVDETEECGDAGVSFGSIRLQPKRISTFIDLSRKLLIQSGPDVEAYVRNEIIDSIAQKLEETIFSDDAATTKSPAGLLYGVTPTTISDFEGICNLEADLDDANVRDDRKYAVSNKAKAALRTMTKGSSLQLVWDSEAIDGTPAYNSSNIGTDKLVIYGDWKNLVIGQWGGLEVTVDEITQARKGCVRLVVNFYCDFAIARPEAFAVGEIGE